MARSQNMPHRSLKKHDDENVVPVVSADFAFLKQGCQEKIHPVLGARHHKTRVSFAHPVQGKSTRNEAYSTFAVNALLQDIRFLDHKKIILKTDQEPAMVALQERIRQLRIDPGEQTILENSPVGESQSNGVVKKQSKKKKA